MKVGTDAVLLGSWVNTESAENILDIGTGSGVIALMLAQRSKAQIDAIEIDAESVEQARANISASAWNNRLNVINTALQDFHKAHHTKYDLIVTNPPYFSNALKSQKDKRNLARHNDSLSFDELIHGIRQLLSHDGHFCLVLPKNESNVFTEKAIINGLFPVRTLSIYPKKERSVKRVLSEFCFQRQHSIGYGKLILRNNDDTFTKEYKALTRAFYLEF